MNEFDNVFGMRVEYSEYTVKKGDSLYAIAKEFNTTVTDLIDINMLTSNTIYPGQVILVPKREETKKYNLEEYIVEEGDTIVKIAEKENVDPVLIGTYNDFGNLELVKGQKILLPKSNTYTVLRGDTVDSILSKTGKSAIELLRDNSSLWFRSGSRITIK